MSGQWKRHIIHCCYLSILLAMSSFAYCPEPTASEASSNSKLKTICDAGLNYTALDNSLQGFHQLKSSSPELKDTLVVIDYTRSANTERFFVIDMQDSTLIRSSLVAHGRNTGEEFATSFSNVPGSYMSSIGFFKTAETYEGKHGRSLRMDGLELGINHLARDRAIVIHKADYVSLDFAAEHGRIGRSLGCPALPLDGYDALLDLIKEGCLMYAYGGDETYAMQSEFFKD